MSYVYALAGCALLFAGFGLVMRHARHKPGCDTCTTSCPAKEPRNG